MAHREEWVFTFLAGKGSLATPELSAEFKVDAYSVQVGCKNFGESISGVVHTEISKGTEVALSFEQTSKNKNTDLNLAIGAAWQVGYQEEMRWRRGWEG